MESALQLWRPQQVSPVTSAVTRQTHKVLTGFSGPTDTKTDEWSSWSSCSVSCGEGWQSRTRLCATSSFSSECTGPLRENRECNNTVVCPGECHTANHLAGTHMEHHLLS